LLSSTKTWGHFIIIKDYYGFVYLLSLIIIAHNWIEGSTNSSRIWWMLF